MLTAEKTTTWIRIYTTITYYDIWRVSANKLKIVNFEINRRCTIGIDIIDHFKHVISFLYVKVIDKIFDKFMKINYLNRQSILHKCVKKYNVLLRS